ncbi:hypothetical protein J6590_018723 [Homalodisca vitripennis]|nr:hypothetical protein J6590_018723 [Homalodisca vitripennis]
MSSLARIVQTAKSPVLRTADFAPSSGVVNILLGENNFDRSHSYWIFKLLADRRPCLLQLLNLALTAAAAPPNLPPLTTPHKLADDVRSSQSDLIWECSSDDLMIADSSPRFGFTALWRRGASRHVKHIPSVSLLFRARHALLEIVLLFVCVITIDTKNQKSLLDVEWSRNIPHENFCSKPRLFSLSTVLPPIWEGLHSAQKFKIPCTDIIGNLLRRNPTTYMNRLGPGRNKYSVVMFSWLPATADKNTREVIAEQVRGYYYDTTSMDLVTVWWLEEVEAASQLGSWLPATEDKNTRRITDGNLRIRHNSDIMAFVVNNHTQLGSWLPATADKNTRGIIAEEVREFECVVRRYSSVADLINNTSNTNTPAKCWVLLLTDDLSKPACPAPSDL